MISWCVNFAVGVQEMWNNLGGTWKAILMVVFPALGLVVLAMESIDFISEAFGALVGVTDALGSGDDASSDFPGLFGWSVHGLESSELARFLCAFIPIPVLVSQWVVYVWLYLTMRLYRFVKSWVPTLGGA